MRARGHDVQEVLHEAARGEEGAFDGPREAADVGLRLGLAVKAPYQRVLSARDLRNVRQCTEDQVRHACGHGCVRDRLALTQLRAVRVGRVICDGQCEDDGGALQSRCDGAGVAIDIGCLDFYALGVEPLGSRAAWVAGQTAQAVFGGE